METFGIAPVEAMSVGRPTIYSNTGPGPEVIEDGVSGLLCDPFNPEDIAEKILKVLWTPGLADIMGHNGRERAKFLFNKSTWIEKNLLFFASCLRSKS
jgi:glycosyltransferase involved in cell wall biosynthesis